MDDDQPARAAAHRLFVFVNPAAVVGERAAVEEFRVGGGRLVGENEDQLALHVEAPEIVPLVFGRGDAVACKHSLRLEGCVCLLGLAHAHEIGEPLEVDRRAGGGRGEGGIGLSLDAHERDFLEVAAVVARRFGAGERELGGDILGGDIAAPLADAAAFEQVAGEEAVVCANALSGDVLSVEGRKSNHEHSDRLKHDRWYPEKR